MCLCFYLTFRPEKVDYESQCSKQSPPDVTDDHTYSTQPSQSSDVYSVIEDYDFITDQAGNYTTLQTTQEETGTASVDPPSPPPPRQNEYLEIIG